MTLQEILKAKGLTVEQIAEIADEMKQNKIFTAGEENLDIRYGKLKQDHEAMAAQYGESTKLIEQLQKDNKDNEALQKSVSDFQAQAAAAQAQLEQVRLSYALQVALMGEKALDVDYLVFKAMEKHPEWKENPKDALDESGKVKGIDDLVAGLKTQHPTQFETSAPDSKKIDPQPLPKGDDRKPAPTNLAEALREQYEPQNM
jgi:seryl-tRNA synthetase